MSDAVYDTTEGEFVDFATLEEWATIDKSKDARIEALIAERDQAWKRAAHAEEMWGRAEVKLAKAVGWFETIRDRAKGDDMAHTYYLDALAAIAALKGESHE